ncbi:TetR/AcrR family transcriptional regulator [Actinomadura barringtoniae]|uniref:TetR/AcrR family transcriptional regulator n=1 Tax=Actinomadura barringtoniae TaxID=1427535 RepID=A0A939PMZ2_9ACTN|nr:TetR/AcrR family transcriptional regulator [Actinomadura barringtoniae]MBO2455771.1 TetR/AcrR family transcriptional regulator [Actinomadura barringtoniae]
MTEGGAPARGRGRPRGPGVDAARRREELLDAAERAIGAMGTSVSLAEVAREAGYARSAVYAAFSGKAEVLAALSERHAGIILLEMFGRATGEREPKSQFAAILDVLFAWAEERPQLYWALIRPLNEDDTGPGLFDLLAGAIETMLGPAQAAAGRDAEMAAPGARAMMGSAIAAIEWWLRGGTAMPRAQLVGYLSDLAWHGGAGLPDGWMGISVSGEPKT